MDRPESETAPARRRTTVERTSDRAFVVRRTFDAPARLVFEAWTRADLFRRWWVPKALAVPLLVCEVDARTGGGYRLEFGHDPANTMAFFGHYLEVVPYERIVWTNEEDAENSSVTTVTFEEVDGRTLLVLSELYPSKEALDEAGTGAAEATRETFAQLDALLVTHS